MSALAETLSALAAVFRAQAVSWYLFGAQAVAVRGAPRATQDIDVTVWIDRARLPELVRALGASAMVPRYPELLEELLAAGSVLPLRHVSGMEVDLVVAGSGLEQLALERATMERVAGIEVPVASATDLAVMKVLAARGKDAEDLRALLAGGAVDVAEVRDLLGQLESALGQSDLVRVFEAALMDIGRE